MKKEIPKKSKPIKKDLKNPTKKTLPKPGIKKVTVQTPTATERIKNTLQNIFIKNLDSFLKFNTRGTTVTVTTSTGKKYILHYKTSLTK